MPAEIKLPLLFSLLFASATALISLTAYTTIQPQIPLFYSLPQPEQQLAPKEFILIIPAVALSIFFIHFLFSQLMYLVDTVIMQVISWCSVILNLLLLFVIIRLLLIV